MLSQDQTEAFRRDGFVAGHVLLASAEVDELRDELDRVIANQGRPEIAQPVRVTNIGDAANPVWQVVNIWQASPAYERHIARLTMVEEVVQLTGARQLRVWHDQIQYKPASDGGVNHWHQDAPLWSPIRPMTQVTAWVALDDVDESNGCLSMVRGSHLWGDQKDFLRALNQGLDLPTTFKERAVQISRCPVEKGQVHYHHALTWHSSHGNRSDRPRRAIAVHYMTEETRYVASGDDHPMRRLIRVADNEVLTGSAFPLVYDFEAASNF
jgi:phytanoyl-CoA hydroxylase